MNNIYLPITEMRKKLFEVTEQAKIPGRIFRITQNGIPSVALISSEELDSLYETLEILSEDPNILKEIKSSKKEFRDKKVVSWNEVKNKYGISNSTPKNSRKNSRKPP